MIFLHLSNKFSQLHFGPTVTGGGGGGLSDPLSLCWRFAGDGHHTDEYYCVMGTAGKI